MDDNLISDDELNALLRERDPLDLTRLNGLLLEPILARLELEIAHTPELEPIPPSLHRPRARRRLIRFAVAGLAVAVAALAGVRVLGDGTSRSLLPSVQLPAAQAAELNRIAQATAAGANPGHGKWLYLETTTTTHQNVGVLRSPVVSYAVTERVQEWAASASGPTRIRVTFSHFTFTSARSRHIYDSHHALFTRVLAPLPLAADHTAVIDSTLPRGDWVSPTSIGNGSDSRLSLSSLPTNPQALVTLLGKNDVKGFFPRMTATERRREEQIFKQLITDNEALGEWIGLSQILTASTSAQQRAEAYRALAYVRFVHVVGERRDARGRRGIEVSFREPGAHEPTGTFIIDPRTGDLLENNSGSSSVTLWLARASVASDTRLPGGATQPQPRTSQPNIAIFRIGLAV